MSRRLVCLFAALLCCNLISTISAEEASAPKPAAAPTEELKPTTPAAEPVPAVAPAATAATGTPATPASTAKAKPAAPSYHPTILSMLTRNNQIRASRGMRPLRISSRLSAAAQNHARYMASTGSFSHYANGSPSGRAAAQGYRSGVRENIAMGGTTVTGTFNQWTNSSGHYANLMSNSGVAGFGYAVGRNGMPYWVAVYGPDDGAP